MDNMKRRNNVQSIGPHQKVPESFIQKWGGEWGCPARDKDGNLLGFCEEMPSDESQWEEAIKTFKAL